MHLCCNAPSTYSEAVVRAVQAYSKSEEMFRVLRMGYSKDRMSAMAIMAAHTLGKKDFNDVVFSLESEMMDTLSGTYSNGEIHFQHWSRYMECDSLFIEGVDGANVRRNMAEAVTRVVELRVKTSKHTVLSSSLSKNEVADFYGEGFSILLKEFFQEVCA